MAETLTLELRLTADGSGVVGEVRASTAELQRLAGAQTKTGRESQRLARASSTLSQRLAGVRRGVNSLRTAMQGLAIGLAVRQIAQTTLAWDAHERALKAVTGSQAAASEELAFARDLAERLGLQMQSLAGDYTRFLAAARGTSLEGEVSREVFVAVAEAARVLGLSSADTTGVLNALQQMISKGTVAAEELRGQLGERLPGAFQIAARAMGVSTAELGEMLEKGEVLADDLLPRLAQQLREEFGGAVEDAADSAAANFARLDNAITDLELSIGNNLVPALAEMADFFAERVLPEWGHWLELIMGVNRETKDFSLGELQRFRIPDLRERLSEIDRSLAPNAPPGLRPAGERRRRQLEEEREQVLRDLRDAEAREQRLEAELLARLPNAGILRGRGLEVGEDFEDMGLQFPRRGAGAAGGEGEDDGELTQQDRLARDLFERGLEAEERAARARRALAEATEQLRDDLDPLRAVQRQYEADLATLEAAQREGIITAQEQADAQRALASQYLAAGEALNEEVAPGLREAREASIDAERAMQDLALSFSSAFEDAIVRGRSLREVLAGIAEDIARIITRQTVTGPLTEALSGFAGDIVTDLFGPPPAASPGLPPGAAGSGAAGRAIFLHDGGVVGRDGRARTVDPRIFIDAPRLHRGGLAGDEVPAILQRGERVLPRGAEGGGVSVTYAPVIQAVDTRSGVEFLGQHSRVIVGLVEDAFNRRGRQGPLR